MYLPTVWPFPACPTQPLRIRCWHHPLILTFGSLARRASVLPCFFLSLSVRSPLRPFIEFLLLVLFCPLYSVVFVFNICPFFGKFIRPLCSLFSSYSSLSLVCFSTSSSSRLSSPSLCLSLLLLVCLLTSFCSYILSSSPPPPAISTPYSTSGASTTQPGPYHSYVHLLLKHLLL